MPDEIVLARMMTGLDLGSSRELYTTMTKGTRVSMIMGSDPTSQDQFASTLCSQQRPPSTWLTTLQPTASSHPSL